MGPASRELRWRRRRSWPDVAVPAPRARGRPPRPRALADGVLPSGCSCSNHIRVGRLAGVLREAEASGSSTWRQETVPSGHTGLLRRKPCPVADGRVLVAAAAACRSARDLRLV